MSAQINKAKSLDASIRSDKSNTNKSFSQSMQSNDFSSNSTDDDDRVLRQKLDFMLNAMLIHLAQFFSITESYVNKLEKIENSNEAHKKHDLFLLIASGEDYSYCVNTIRILLKPATTNSEAVISPEIIASYQHRLVLQVARDIKSAKRWCRLLEMYSSSRTQNNLIIKKWNHAIQMISELDFLVDV
ncbi:hypothetical protein [Methylomonas sp. MgM2]